jgi:predicted porin
MGDLQMGESKAMRSKSIVRRKTNSRWGKVLLSAIASVGFVTGANAADLTEIFAKGAPPVMPDLTWQGITVIGAIDVGAQYESHGAPYASQITSPQNLILPSNGGPKFFLAPNNVSISFIGLAVNRKITEDFSFIARLEAGIIPTTGDLINGPKSLQMSNGVPLAQQNSNGDSSRAGQLLNGEAYAGIDGKSWGQIRAGRNNIVSLDMYSAYDLGASGAFSLPIFQGGNPGEGSSETVKLDDSVKYLNQIGMFRTELIYGAPGTSTKELYQGTIGIIRPEFSIDLLGGKSKDSVSLSALSATANFGSPFLGAKVFDTSTVGVFAKYSFDVGGKGYNTPVGKFIVSGGWDRVDYSNPSDNGFLPGHTTIGGFVIGPALSTTGSAGGGVLNYAYIGGDRLLDLSFISGKYQYDEQWSVMGAYYHMTQNSFGLGVTSRAGYTGVIYSGVSCSTNAFTNCSGAEDVISLRVDYDWTKNTKLYAGIAYSQVKGGLSFGYLNTSMIDPTVGIRYAF